MFDTLTRMGASGAGDYEIERSVRFYPTDGQVLQRTPSSQGDRRVFTLSWWMKLSKPANSTSTYTIFSAQRNTLNPSLKIRLQENRLVVVGNKDGSGSSYMFSLVTEQLFRDPSAWYHFVVAFDTTDGTSSNRIKIYVNGSQVTNFAAGSTGLSHNTYPSSNDQTAWGSNEAEQFIGRHFGGSDRFDGYLTEIHYVDGSQLTPSSFGETNADTGQWVPKKYGGGYGNSDNGCYLNFSDNSNTTAATLGKDSSGNGNNWTPYNFSVSAGVGNDSLEDTPTNNFATLNSVDGYSTLSYEPSNGGLDYNISDTSAIPYSTIAIPTSGKWYAEFTAADIESGCFGCKPIEDFGLFSKGYLYTYHGKIWKDNSETQTVATISDGDVIGVAVDRTAQTVQFSKNGTNIGNTEALVAGQEYKYWIARYASSGGNPMGSANFGQRAFSHQPNDFKGLCTKNLSTPTILKGTDHFNTVLYTGNDSSNLNSITGVGFQPNLVWGKSRNDTIDHILFDSVRGDDRQLNGNVTDAEVLRSNPAYRFISDGFQVATAGNLNNPVNYAAWCWKESASAGFDIVSFTPSSGTNTYSHGLGVKPNFIIFKSRGSAANWDVYNSVLTADYKLYLNTADDKIDSGFMSDTEPTSSVFSFNPGNQDGNAHIAYCWSQVAGYSKFGSYTGNGNANGPFVYTGFKPAWVMLKITSTNGYNWLIFDNKREGYNQENHMFLPNESHEEKTSGYGEIDILSNGFKLRSNENDGNKSGDTMIYAAFAESPFKYSNAR